MEAIDFLGLNVIIIGFVGLGLFIYLLFLIRKRYGEKFLHKKPPEEE